MSLRQLGWWVTGDDADRGRAKRALELGAVDALGRDLDAELTVVAVPAGAVAKVTAQVLELQDSHAPPGAPGSPGQSRQDPALRVSQLQARHQLRVVTDVAGVKDGVVRTVSHPRFVGGHPMAGSEQEGVDGATPDMFLGATWVLTPGDITSPDAFAAVQSVVRSLGANPVTLSPRRHDELVALVSHTPHLTAAALMNIAADVAESDATLLRLAAGGFRDMTRIAAGHPGIWPDIVAENRDAILAGLDRLSATLGGLRQAVAAGDRQELLRLLERARQRRVNLPTGAPALGHATEVRLPVPDRPGVIAEVAMVLGAAGVNIFDLEIAHSAEGDHGVLVLIVDASAEELVRSTLAARGYRPAFRHMPG
jgi:prephenate dehydrogenase